APALFDEVENVVFSYAPAQTGAMNLIEIDGVFTRNITNQRGRTRFPRRLLSKCGLSRGGPGQNGRRRRRRGLQLGRGRGRWSLRWQGPRVSVGLCGLLSAWTSFNQRLGARGPDFARCWRNGSGSGGGGGRARARFAGFAQPRDHGVNRNGLTLFRQNLDQ